MNNSTHKKICKPELLTEFLGPPYYVSRFAKTPNHFINSPSKTYGFHKYNFMIFTSSSSFPSWDAFSFQTKNN